MEEVEEVEEAGGGNDDWRPWRERQSLVVGGWGGSMSLVVVFNSRSWNSQELISLCRTAGTS